MAKYILKIAPGQHGTVLAKEISPNEKDPWSGALATTSRLLKAGDGLIPPGVTAVTIHLERVEEGEG